MTFDISASVTPSRLSLANAFGLLGVPFTRIKRLNLGYLNYCTVWFFAEYSLHFKALYFSPQIKEEKPSQKNQRQERVFNTPAAIPNLHALHAHSAIKVISRLSGDLKSFFLPHLAPPTHSAELP